MEDKNVINTLTEPINRPINLDKAINYFLELRLTGAEVEGRAGRAGRALIETTCPANVVVVE